MAAKAVTSSAAEALEFADMQGLVARAYGNLPFARYVLCRINEPAAARAWLRGLTDSVFTADRPSDDGPCLNLAFTWDGLRRLGLPDDALATFPKAMAEGMVTPRRSRILGDVGASDPSTWRWGGGGPDRGALHVLVMIFAGTEEALDQEHRTRRADYQAGGALEEVGEPIEGRLLADKGREHFGFADGLSQPLVKGWPKPDQKSVHPPAPPTPVRFAEVDPGEIILGYTDNFGKPAEGPTVAGAGGAAPLPKAPWAKGRRDLGRNGSFLVFRQLAQDVVGFQRALASASHACAMRGDGLSPEQVGAKMMGRWPSGAPIVLHPHRDPGTVEDNDFGYAEKDLHGLACPLGAHVRRANPRDSSEDSPEKTLKATLNHRILRRGRPYGRAIADPPAAGEEASAERGLLFICLNSDIERQFEFVQQTWLNNPFFAGLNGEVDPVVGPLTETGAFTIPDDPVRRRVTGVGGYVTVRGGAYFFLPGIKALRFLSSIPG